MKQIILSVILIVVFGACAPTPMHEIIVVTSTPELTATPAISDYLEPASVISERLWELHTELVNQLEPLVSQPAKLYLPELYDWPVEIGSIATELILLRAKATELEPPTELNHQHELWIKSLSHAGKVGELLHEWIGDPLNMGLQNQILAELELSAMYMGMATEELENLFEQNPDLFR